MKGEKDSKRADKKVRDFFKEREKTVKRFKSLCAYIEDAPESSQKEFFNTNYEAIFTVFLARFDELENVKREKKNKKPHVVDCLSCLGVLKAFLLYLPLLVKKRWQFANIARVLEKSLDKRNRHSVRLFSFEILLMFIETLQASIEDQVHVMHTALNLDPFTGGTPSGHSKRDRLTLSPDEAAGVLCPASQNAIAKDAIELLDLFFSYISTRPLDTFEFWYDLWKVNYFTTFYPEFAKSFPIVAEVTDLRFEGHAPWDVQRCLVDRLERWLDLSSVATHVWSPENSPLLFEILRQTCKLPIYYSSITKKSVAVYRKYLLNTRLVVDFDPEQLQLNYRELIRNISLVFLVDSTSEEVPEHSDICTDVFKIYEYFSVDLSRKITQETWVCLQTTMLETTHALLTKSAPFANTIADREATRLLENLYIVWLRSPHTTEEMWGVFLERMSSLLHWRQVVQQWSDCLLQLTYILLDHYYPEDAEPHRDGPSGVADASSGGGGGGGGVGSMDDRTSTASGAGASGAGDGASGGSPSSPDKCVGTHNSSPSTGAADKSLPSSTHPATSTSDASAPMAASHSGGGSGGGGGAAEGSPTGTASTAVGGSSTDPSLSTSGGAWGITSSSPTKSPRKSTQQRDRNYSALSWDRERIMDVWRTILGILGNPSSIESPPNFALAVQCISQLVDLFLLEEAHLGLEESPAFSIYEIFLPWLVQLCNVGDKRNKGRLSALSTLCKMFCRPHKRPTDAVSLSHFYRVIQMMLSLSHSSILWMVLRHAHTIFTLDLPGVSILIPDFVREVNRLWTKGATALPQDIQNKALRVLNSILCYSSYFEGIPLPHYETPTHMQRALVETFRNAVSYKDINTPVKIAALKGICVVAYDQIYGKSADKQLVTDCVNLLLQHALDPDDGVAHICLEAIGSMSEGFSLVAEFAPELVYRVVESLSGNIIAFLNAAKVNPRGLRESVVAFHFASLLPCLLRLGSCPALQLPQHCSTKVFTALEWGLLGDDLTASPSVSSHRSMTTPSKGPSSGRAKGKTALASGGAGTSAPLSSGALNTLFERLRLAPVHKSDPIREAAEVFLLTVLNHFANFPSLAGASQLIAIPPEDAKKPSGSVAATLRKRDADVSEDEAVYFIYNGLTLLVLRELKIPEEASEATVRMTVRDCTGKYVWDFRPRTVLEPLDEPHISPAWMPKVQNLLGPSTRTRRPALSKEGRIRGSTKRRPSEPPFFEKLRTHNANSLSEFLQYMDEINTEHPEFQPLRRPSLSTPIAPPQVYAEDLDHLLHAIDEQDQVIKDVAEASRSHGGEADGSSAPLSQQLYLPPPAPVRFHHCRLLLSQLGLLEGIHTSRLSFLQNGQRLQRSLKELDKVNGREVAKIGVLYVAKGQSDQYAILRNDLEARSEEYAAFVNALGWTVDLATHRGFRGGLDVSSFTAGKVAPYWASSTQEVIFHDVTLMPTKEKDQQQIHKKRHVGNDIVHVVWNEDDHPYEPGTITSQFNDVHIVVVPMRTGLFRIRIYSKIPALLFGPLHDGMVLHPRLAALLVRTTAINANRAVRRAKGEYKSGFMTRGGLISEMNTRYKANRPFNDFLLSLFPDLAIVPDKSRGKSPPPRASSPPPSRSPAPSADASGTDGGDAGAVASAATSGPGEDAAAPPSSTTGVSDGAADAVATGAKDNETTATQKAE